jgi:Chaperone of endosialidase
MKAIDIRNITLGAVIAVSGLSALAAVNLTTFTAGTPIKSSEVNANFSSLKANIEALQAPGGISGAQLAASSVNTTKLATTGTVADGKVLKLSGGNLVWGDDIVGSPGTSYTADGSSLALSGTAFFVKDAGISTTKIADEAVTGAKIAPNAVAYGRIADGGVPGTKLQLPLTLSGGFGNSAVIKGVDSGGIGFGLWGESTTSTGVYGKSTAGSGVGVQGKSDTNIGVFGDGAKYGVFGVSSTGAGVEGIGGSGGYAAEFTGGKFGSGTCYYAGGAGWSCTSDRRKKENFRAVNTQAVLEALVNMPITRWNMKNDAKRTPHLGPVAQDFKAAFGLGENDTTINTADAQGVALAAIKGVYEKNRALEQQVQTLEARLAALEKAVRSR